MVTAGTYLKQHFFDSEDKLNYLEEALISELKSRGWEVHAWAIFPNHYHFVGRSPDRGADLQQMMGTLHRSTATWVNHMDDKPGRKVWFNYWDTRLTYQRSYIVRLAYVHTNAVKHGLVTNPESYRWCSAPWFSQTADPPFYETVMGIRTDKVRVIDDF